jgi:hypothetical protein
MSFKLVNQRKHIICEDETLDANDGIHKSYSWPEISTPQPKKGCYRICEPFDPILDTFDDRFELMNNSVGSYSSDANSSLYDNQDSCYYQNYYSEPNYPMVENSIDFKFEDKISEDSSTLDLCQRNSLLSKSEKYDEYQNENTLHLTSGKFEQEIEFEGLVNSTERNREQEMNEKPNVSTFKALQNELNKIFKRVICKK